MKKPSFRVKAEAGRLRLSGRGASRQAWLGACYLMSARAYVGIEMRRGAPSALFWPKPGQSLADLAQAFSSLYQEQVRGWAQARRRRRQALAAAAVPSPSPGTGTRSLARESAARIERLLAEEPEIPDPLGIRTPWDARRGSRGAAG